MWCGPATVTSRREGRPWRTGIFALTGAGAAPGVDLMPLIVLRGMQAVGTALVIEKLGYDGGAGHGLCAGSLHLRLSCSLVTVR